VIRPLYFVLALAGLAPIADAPGPPSGEEIAKAVQQLGADDYRAREQATAWLWAAGPAAEDALKAGLKSADAEVVARCRDLLDKIPYGITPDMPRRFVELIAAARAGGAGGWPAVAPDLLDLGPRGLEVARRLIDRLANNDGQREGMRRTLDLEGWRVAPALLAAGQADKAGELLERSAVMAAMVQADLIAVRHYAAFLATQGKLAEQLPRWRLWAEKHHGNSGGVDGRMPDGSPDGRVSLVVLAHLARLHGDLAEARKAAEQTGRADLIEAILFDQGAWADLAATPAPAGSYAAAVTVGLRGMYSAAAGKSAESAAALTELKSLPVTRISAFQPPIVFRALMYAGRPADALTALAKYKLDDGVLPQFEVLCQQDRYAEAFAKLEKPVGEHTTFRWQWDTAKLRVYHIRGERDKFQQTLAALSAYDTLSPPEATAAQDTVEFLVGIDRAAAALPIAAALLSGGAPPADVFGKLFPKAPLGAEIWWRYERLQHPAEPMRAIVARLPALVDKRLAMPEGRAALEAAVKVARAQIDADADRWLQGLADSCQAAGLDEQARAFCKEAAERTNTAAAWLRLGDLHVEAQQYADAAVAYEKAWRENQKQVLPLWLRGWALEKAGQPGGREARELAHALPLADEDARLKFSEELVKRAAFGLELEAAARDQRRLIVRLSNPGANVGRNAQGMLSSDVGAFADRIEAAACTQRFLFRLLRTSAYFKREQGYLIVLHRHANYRAQGLLAKGDVAGAVREAEAALATLPGSSEPVTALVPELVKGGHTAEADRLYAAAAAAGDRLCKDYPQSAEFRNNRAWLAARCRRDLDLALEYGRKAVELEPEHANCRDTLAEVLFQRGDKTAAVAEIKRCIELEPKNTIFKRQLARIEAGDPAAALPGK
jgi:tetratricopeptide (TPR) repeat protein